MVWAHVEEHTASRNYHEIGLRSMTRAERTFLET
jgi:hypothetical protein